MADHQYATEEKQRWAPRLEVSQTRFANRNHIAKYSDGAYDRGGRFGAPGSHFYAATTISRPGRSSPPVACSLAEELPDVSEQVTRLPTFPNARENIPPGTSALQVCTDPDSDRRRVVLSVIDHQQRDIVAVIMYGWADREYYVDWLDFEGPKLIDEGRN